MNIPFSIKDLIISSCWALSKYPYYPKKPLEQKGAKYLGGFGCHGKVNYFPFSAFGGVNNDKPDENDIKNGAEFLKKLVEENP